MQKYDFPWYDYTKSFTRMSRYLDGKMPENYHLLFSMSEDEKNQGHCGEVLRRGADSCLLGSPKRTNCKLKEKTYRKAKL